MSSSLKYIIFGSIISLALSHTNQKERVDTNLVKPDTLNQASSDNTTVRVDTMAEDINEIRYGKTSIHANLDDFPSLHPIVVHFAISLIVVAALLQLMNIFFFKKDIAWIILLLIVIGFVAALISSKSLHPQTTGLAERTAEILEYHDVWAQWTLRTAFAAVILQIIHMGITRFDKLTFTTPRKTGIPLRKNRLIMMIIAVIMLASTYSVLRTGHFGAQLVHIEGVGPRGNFLVTGE